MLGADGPAAKLLKSPFKGCIETICKVAQRVKHGHSFCLNCRYTMDGLVKFAKLAEHNLISRHSRCLLLFHCRFICGRLGRRRLKSLLEDNDTLFELVDQILVDSHGQGLTSPDLKQRVEASHQKLRVFHVGVTLVL